ncbi:MAG: hypothetical protein ABW175_22895 [Bradyrhizobium sp.]
MLLTHRCVMAALERPTTALWRALPLVSQTSPGTFAHIAGTLLTTFSAAPSIGSRHIT